MHEATVVNMLLRWARNRLKTGNPLGYPGHVSFMKLVPSSTQGFADPGVEAECVLTEEAYKLLPVLHQSVIWVEFLSTAISLDQKAHCFGRSVRRYRECLTEAYVMIGNLIEIKQEKRMENERKREIEVINP